MRTFNILIKLSWTFLVAIFLTFGLAGCEGDDGAPGATGGTGPQGLPGDPGAEGPPGTAASVLPLESCAVCHDTNAIADAGAAHTLPPIEAVSNITFAAVNAGADLAVTFDVAADGVAATNYDEVQRAYVTDGVFRTDFRDPVTDELTVATLANNGGGNYTITVAGAGPEVANDNRWLFRVGVAGDRETRVYFYGDTGAVRVVEDLAISAAACNACHGPEGIGVHGGYFAAEDGGEPCLTCHGVERINRDGEIELTPRLVTVAHGYHNSIASWEDPPEAIEPHVTYPTYLNNCSVCHAEEAQLAAANSMLATQAACFSCHGSLETMFDPDRDDQPYASTREFHLGNELGGCEGCHRANLPAQAFQVVTDFHNGATTERGGIIWDGVDTSVTEGAKIAWTITGVADDGTNLAISWTATYDNGTGPVAVDPCNDTAGVGAPVFFADEDAEGNSLGNLSILRNYAKGQDFILGTRLDRAGQPGGTPGVNNANTTCDDSLVATTVVLVQDLADTAAEGATVGRVAIQGKPRVVSIDPDDADGLMAVRAKSPTFDWLVGVGGAVSEDDKRRAIADTSLCLNCHVGSLYQHGGNRVDNIDLCMLCHNVAANDEYVRVDEFGVDASESYDRRAGQAFGIKELAHGVHPAGARGNPLAVYRGRGIYAWATSADQLRNWPTGDNCTQEDGDTGSNYFTVVGSEDAPADGSDTCQPHIFHAPTYPRGLYDCAACHVQDDPETSTDEGFALLPNPRVAMATTVEAGDPPFGDQVNDVLQGVQTTSCVTCHADSATKGHAYQNSWVPQAFEEGRQTIIDAN